MASFFSLPLNVPLANLYKTFSPWVILSDFGGAFSMGAIGGGVWHGIKGARNSPRVRLPVYSLTDMSDYNCSQLSLDV
jgi:hypothetical protein